jgi:hypothetical protein
MWPCCQRHSTNPLTWETGVEVLAYFLKVMRGCAILLEVNVSLSSSSNWNEELLEHVQIHDTSSGRLHEEEGAIHSFFAEGIKHIHLWAVTNMFQGGKWIFAAPDPAVVGIELTTDKKRTLITENSGVQKSLIILYLMKHLHTKSQTILSAIVRCRTMDSLYAFKCKRLLNTRHTVTFGIPL